MYMRERVPCVFSPARHYGCRDTEREIGGTGEHWRAT